MEIFEDKKEMVLLAISVVIFMVLAVTVFWSLRFTASELNLALNPNLIQKPEPVRFDLERIDLLVK